MAENLFGSLGVGQNQVKRFLQIFSCKWPFFPYFEISLGGGGGGGGGHKMFLPH